MISFAQKKWRPDFAKRSQRAWAGADRDQSGMAAVEFAAIAPFFVGFLLALVQIAIVWIAKAELSNGTNAAARLVLTGQAQTQGLTQAQFTSALCANLPIIFQCSGLMLNLQPQTSLTSVNTATPTLTYGSNGAVTNTWVYTPGTSGQIMVLQVLYQLPVIAGPLLGLATQSNGSLLLVATAVFRNEAQ